MTVKEVWTRVRGHRRYSGPLEWPRTLGSKLNLLPYLNLCSKVGRQRGGPPLPRAPTALQACHMRASWWLYPLKSIFKYNICNFNCIKIANIIFIIIQKYNWYFLFSIYGIVFNDNFAFSKVFFNWGDAFPLKLFFFFLLRAHLERSSCSHF